MNKIVTWIFAGFIKNESLYLNLNATLSLLACLFPDQQFSIKHFPFRSTLSPRHQHEKQPKKGVIASCGCCG